MKTHLLGIAAMAAALSFVGANCNQPPQPPPNPDASDAAPSPPAPGDACTQACASLASPAVACPIGALADCPKFMARDYPEDGSGKLANPATGKPMRCSEVAAVRTRADAQKLGFVCR